MWVLTVTSSELSCLCNDPSLQLTATCTPLHENIDHSGHALSSNRQGGARANYLMWKEVDDRW
jgi:hypothetical protein